MLDVAAREMVSVHGVCHSERSEESPPKVEMPRYARHDTKSRERLREMFVSIAAFGLFQAFYEWASSVFLHG